MATVTPSPPLPQDLETPYLLVDVDTLDRNIARMAESGDRLGLELRPHAKTHKCVEIARRQIAAGAVGLTVATVGEAEVFADAGIDDLFIAYPVWAAGSRATRLRGLAERVRLRVGVDSVEAAELLARTVGSVDVLIEVDSGQHRSGVHPSAVAAVGGAAARSGHRILGVFTFPGHGYGPGQRASAAQDEARALIQAASALEAAGIAAPVRSGGSTPTADLTDPSLTELRPGVYVFHDAQQVELGVVGWPDVALTAVATVVSRSGRSVILDAGSKTLGADRPGWTTGFGRLPDHPEARVTALSEHHTTVDLGPSEQLPELGSMVRVAPNHVCAAVNLADELVAWADGKVVERWRVAARGAV